MSATWRRACAITAAAAKMSQEVRQGPVQMRSLNCAPRTATSGMR